MKWDKEKVRTEALKYSSKADWERANQYSYQLARKNGWLKELSAHMTPLKKSWTYDLVKEEAKRFSSRKEWQTKSPSSYQVARRNGWLESLTAHMSLKKKSWTKEQVLLEAKKFGSRADWQRSSQYSYTLACKKGWLVEASQHMVLTRKEFWTKDECKNYSIKYQSKIDWIKDHPASYHAALKNGWLEECSSHMRKPDAHRIWHKDKVFGEAKGFSSRVEWQLKSPSSYQAARKLGILEEASRHMNRIGGISNPEKFLMDTIRQRYPKAHSTYFTVKDPKFHPAKRFQLDIYVPELRKGIEFNGDYWHSFEGLKRGRPTWTNEQIENYHELKKRFFKDKEIEILEVWEKDWKENKDLVIEQCLSFLLTDHNDIMTNGG